MVTATIGSVALLTDLEAIRDGAITAITALQSGLRSYTMADGRSVQHHDLPQLWESYHEAVRALGVEQAKTLPGGRRNYASLGRLTQ